MVKLDKKDLLGHLEFMFSTVQDCANQICKPIYPPIEQAYGEIREIIKLHFDEDWQDVKKELGEFMKKQKA